MGPVAATSSVALRFPIFAGVGSEEEHLAMRASVRRSNCTCGFPACSFHEESEYRDVNEGINLIRFTSPYSR
jgi:hypothetical protein